MVDLELILQEWSYRSKAGYPNLSNDHDITVLIEILYKHGFQYNQIHEIVTFLQEKHDTKSLSPEEKQKAHDLGLVGKGGNAWGPKSSNKITHRSIKGKLEPVKDVDKASNEPEKKQIDPGFLTQKEKQQLKSKENQSKSDQQVKIYEEPNKVFGDEIDDDTIIKNDILRHGYNGYEQATGFKPAPGGPGGAFNELISGEAIHILSKNDKLSVKDLAHVLFNQFKETQLSKEQKRSREIKVSDLPHDLPEHDRSMYSKFIIAAQNGFNKFKNTRDRISSLQQNNLLGNNIKIHTFYGSKISLNEQMKLVSRANKIFLKNGQEIQKDDLKKWISLNGKGMNPTDTATFVSDDNRNLLVQFHADKTSPDDIQSNSTLSQQNKDYDKIVSEIELPKEIKNKALNIIKEYSRKVEDIEQYYNEQAVPIAQALQNIDFGKQLAVVSSTRIKDHSGYDPMLKNDIDSVLIGTNGFKRKFLKYTSKEPKRLTLSEKYKIILDAVTDGIVDIKSARVINKVAMGLQIYHEKKKLEVPAGIDAKNNLSKQRETVVKLQREQIDKLNQYQVKIGNDVVPLGNLTEGKHLIDSLHLSMMDYPPKGYNPGNISSITGAALDGYQGEAQINGKILRKSLGVETTEQFLSKFNLEDDEQLTYDSYGNVTGKNVFSYLINKEDGSKMPFAYKSYRSKSGAAGRTKNMIYFTKEFQKVLIQNSQDAQ